MTAPAPSPAEFWSRVTTGAESECWEWAGIRNRQGYGQLTARGRTRRAHRLAYELANGPIPPGMFVCHQCDNPPCCNPAHLFTGTATDNNRDRHTKGRTVVPYQVPRSQKPHGTRSRYKSGCKCDECRKASSEHRAALRRAQGVMPVGRQADQPHGTRPRYRSGCRCDPCRQAESARRYANWKGLPHAAAK